MEQKHHSFRETGRKNLERKKNLKTWRNRRIRLDIAADSELSGERIAELLQAGVLLW